MDLEAEYNNRARVPGHPAVIARWRRDAEAARGAHPPRPRPYGASERGVIDLFDVGPDRPWVVFLHGGYWQALGREDFSWVAPPLMAHGLNVAIPSYDLAPDCPLDAILRGIGAMAAALRAETGQTPVVVGHSAGGHMAAWLVADMQARSALAISGVFELEPLVSTSLNAALCLDRETARDLSASARTPPAGAVLDCWVGAEESREFLRQSRDMADRWAGLGATTRFESMAGADHFSVLDPLGDADSPLLRRLVEMAGA
ncbi:alpha/beta hydrolase [Brevundimonas lutea]|uniref:alpha/beta hydrolase n=1 Tax=Brevundimonas lutea TaxID=2293980 RepID=UPI001F0BD888|nr:alpha/beta hydrolase [Brevundimonas lutea]